FAKDLKIAEGPENALAWIGTIRLVQLRHCRLQEIERFQALGQTAASMRVPGHELFWIRPVTGLQERQVLLNGLAYSGVAVRWVFLRGNAQAVPQIPIVV